MRRFLHPLLMTLLAVSFYYFVFPGPGQSGLLPDASAQIKSPAEEERMGAQSSEPGGTLEEHLWQVLVLIGIGDREPTNWDGSVGVSAGELHQVEGYRFVAPDRILSTGGWRMSTQVVTFIPKSFLAPDGRTSQKEIIIPKGLLMRGAGNSSTRVTLELGDENVLFSPMRMSFGGVDKFLDGRVEVRRIPAATDLSGTELRQHDFPDLGAANDGRIWATWLSNHDRREELNLRVLVNGRWSRLIPVARASADLWRPQVVADDKDHPWLVWSQQVDGNWDIYAMVRQSEEEWGELHRLSDDPLPDIEPHVAAGPDGSVYVVWQSMVEGFARIRMRYLRNGRWSNTIAVTESESNDWDPAVAIGRDGRVWIAWDRYNESYDVYARSFSPLHGLSAEMQVTDTKRFEASVSVAVDQQNRPWIAWESGAVNWGKDLGRALGADSPGSSLGDRRRIEVVCLDNGQWKAPATLAPRDSLHLGSAGESRPGLFVDPAGNLWMSFKRRYSFHVYDRSVYWESYLTRLNGDRWLDPIPLPHSWSRKSVRMGLAAAGGRLWAFWPDENRILVYAGRPFANRVMAGSLTLPGGGPEPRLTPYIPPSDAARPGHLDEAGDIAALRRHRIQVGRESLRIVRGDLHRHTELSQDSGGLGDGSLPELYRYMIDVADLDFGASTDHQGGGVDYWNFLILKMADMYHFPDRFVTLYGYERNVSRPFGHRNIFHTQRDYPIVPFFQRISPRFMLPDTPEGELLTQNSANYGGVNVDDAKLLYEELRKTGGLAIPHTSAGANRWEDNDPRLDPAVEIYQGARGSSEHKQATRWWNDPDYGWVWDAWKKGYRMGVIASSDHFSTHISYAMVYTAEKNRQAIFDSILKRRTYGATDNILLEFWLGEHFMGDDFTTSAPERIRVKVRGTAPVASIHLIRDAQYIYKWAPQKQTVEFEYVDRDVAQGEHWYYVRVEQTDGQVAWSSPIWVRYQ